MSWLKTLAKDHLVKCSSAMITKEVCFLITKDKEPVALKIVKHNEKYAEQAKS
jgi:hypothetical protein